jgi:hypothetical protein
MIAMIDVGRSALNGEDLHHDVRATWSAIEKNGSSRQIRHDAHLNGVDRARPP